MKNRDKKTRDYFRNWGLRQEDTKKGHFHNKKVKKGTPNLTSPYVHSFFTTVMTKQFFEKNNSPGQRLEIGLTFGLK